MSRFDRVILAAVLGLGLAVAALSIASARLGPTVDSMSTAQVLDGASVSTQIGVTFTESMNVRSVERNFRVQPSAAGDFTWSGNTLLYIPRRPLSYGTTYEVTVGSGATDTTGKRLFRTFHGRFHTQSPHLLLLGAQGNETHRLILASITGQREVIGSDDGLVTDFSLSLDRSLAVYVKRSATGERPDEMWIVSLADNSSQRIFRHADWSISMPHFSPDGRYIVFLATNVRLCAKYYGCYRDATGPIIYLFDLQSHRAFPFKSAMDVPITNFIDFSPAGQLAYTDLGSALTLADPLGRHILHIPNRGNSLEYSGFDPIGDKVAFVGQTPSSTGGDVLVYSGSQYLDVSQGVYDSSTPAFSTSGNEVAYAAYRGEQGIEPIYGINVYNFKTHATRRLTAESQWSDWSPRWSPDDRYITFIRSQPQEAMYMGSGEVWVMKSDGTAVHPLGVAGTGVEWAF